MLLVTYFCDVSLERFLRTRFSFRKIPRRSEVASFEVSCSFLRTFVFSHNAV